MKKKLIAFFLGFAVLIVFFELFLFVISQIKSNRPSGNYNGKPVILFVGNSYTAGIEVKENERFTSLIQNMLPDFNVQNEAKVNINTGYIRNHMDEWVQQKPKIVFLMIGEPNAWNNEGYLRFLNEQNLRVGLVRNVLFFLNNNLRFFKLISYFSYQIRLLNKQAKDSDNIEFVCQQNFKKFMIAYDNNSLKDLKSEFLSAANQDRLTECVDQQISKYPDIHMPRYIRVTRMILQNKPIEMLMPDFMFLTKNGTSYNHFVYEYIISLDKSKKSISNSSFRKLKNNLSELVKNKFLKKQIQIIKDGKPWIFFSANKLQNNKSIINNLFLKNLDYAADIHFYIIGSRILRKMKDFDGACRVLITGLRNYPFEYKGVNLAAYLLSASQDCSSELKNASNRIIKDLINKKLLDNSVFFLYNDQAELADWRYHDINIIADFFKSQGAVVVFQTYFPRRQDNLPKDENSVLVRISKEQNYLLLDHFENLINKYPEIEKRDFIYLQGKYKGTADDHLSPEGHKEIADQIYNFLKKQDIQDKYL